MKININPKKELYKWGPTNIKLIYGSMYLETVLIKVKKYYPWPMPPNLILYKNGRLLWINEYSDLGKTGLKYFKKYFLNLKNYKSLWKKWEDWIKDYKITASKLEKLDFEKITDKELYYHLKQFYNLYVDFWVLGHVPEISNWGGEYFLRRRLQELYKNKAEKYLEILTAPVKFSFFQNEELDLLKLAFIKDKKKFKKALKEHAKKYHWILNSYNGVRVLTSSYFEKKLKMLLKEKSAKAKIKEIKEVINKHKKDKKLLIKKIKLDKKLVFMANQLSQSIWWQDLRKSYIWKMNYLLDKFLKEICKRKHLKYEDLQNIWTYELFDILKGKKVDIKEIKNRTKYCAHYFEEGKFEEIKNKKRVKKLFKLYSDVKVKGKEVKGLVVSKGKISKIKGYVKIIKNPFKEEKKMKQGNILVAGMTSPEYIVVMKKAKAVITDHGGMTCHAAIVSRELKIPCIVNTKIATKVLKDNDLVEVDADEGVVRKIGVGK